MGRRSAGVISEYELIILIIILNLPSLLLFLLIKKIRISKLKRLAAGVVNDMENKC